MRYKQNTGQVRSRLDHLALDKWKELTRFTNLTGVEKWRLILNVCVQNSPSSPKGRVSAVLKQKVKPELLTNAWAKMFELHNHFNLIPPENGPKSV